MDGTPTPVGSDGTRTRDDSGALVHRLRFETNDLDETVRIISANYGHHSRVVWERGRFEYGFDAVNSRQMAIGTMRVRLRQTIRAAVIRPTLFMPLRAAEEFRVGRRVLRCAPGSAVFLAPGHEYSLTTDSNDVVGLRLDTGLLQGAVAALRRGRTGSLQFRCFELPLDGGDFAEITAWRQGLDACADLGGAADLEAVDAVERAATNWLAARVIEQSGEAPVLPATLERVAGLRRWVDSHLSEDISLDRLCTVTGVRWRALQKACVVVAGVTPLELVASRRLAAVRRLLASGRATSVSRAAMDCGFTHLGRFSAAYRQAYGESPSTTLAQAPRE